MEITVDGLKGRILAAKGEIPADLVLKRGRVVNVFSGSIKEWDVAIYDGFIAGLGPDYAGREETDVKDKMRVGPIESHTFS